MSHSPAQLLRLLILLALFAAAVILSGNLLDTIKRAI